MIYQVRPSRVGQLTLVVASALIILLLMLTPVSVAYRLAVALIVILWSGHLYWQLFVPTGRRLVSLDLRHNRWAWRDADGRDREIAGVETGIVTQWLITAFLLDGNGGRLRLLVPFDSLDCEQHWRLRRQLLGRFGRGT